MRTKTIAGLAVGAILIAGGVSVAVNATASTASTVTITAANISGITPPSIPIDNITHGAGLDGQYFQLTGTTVVDAQGDPTGTHTVGVNDICFTVTTTPAISDDYDITLTSGANSPTLAPGFHADSTCGGPVVGASQTAANTWHSPAGRSFNVRANGVNAVLAGTGYKVDVASNGATSHLSVAYSTDVDAVTYVDLTNPRRATQNPWWTADATDQVGSTNRYTVNGTVYNRFHGVRAGKTVTLTGSAGVYFGSTAGLAATKTVATSGSGEFIAPLAYFTLNGAAKISATSGAVTRTSGGVVSCSFGSYVGQWGYPELVTTRACTPYKVTVGNAAGSPGAHLPLKGTVVDAFGNAAAHQRVALSLGTGILGALDSSTPETLFDGTYGTQFTSDPSVTNGTGAVTARFSPTLPVNATGDPTADPSWALAGIVLADGAHTATGTVKVAQDTVTLAGPTSQVNAGNVTLTGATIPNRAVSIYGRPVSGGSLRLISTTTADNAGSFSTTLRMVKSTVFTATINSGGVSATPITVTIQSSIAQFTAKALGKGKVRLFLNGDPNAAATARFYVRSGNAWKRIAVVVTDERGVIGVTAKSPTGSRTFKVTWTAPGTVQGTATAAASIN